MRLLVAAASALLLCGCEVYAVPDPPPCPGERQGVFDWGATLVVTPPSNCFFAQPASPVFQVKGSFTFQGAVNFGVGDDKAYVCPSLAHAVPREGIRFPPDPVTGDVQIRVSYTNRSGSVGGYTCPSQLVADASQCLCPSNTLENCSCPVIVTETIDGLLTPVDPARPAAGFQGFVGTQAVDVQMIAAVPSNPCRYVDPDPSPPTWPDPCAYAYDLEANLVGAR